MITDYDAEIAVAASEHGIDPRLLTALVLTESSGRADAFRYEKNVATWFMKNPKAAGLCERRACSSYGLCQVLYATATDYGFSTEPEYLFIPRANLDLGARILKDLLRWARGDEAKALQAYNGGRGGVGTPQTIAYSQRVLKRKAAL